jgi:hypothetical protein
MKKLLFLTILLLSAGRLSAQVPSTYVPQLITYQGIPFGGCAVYQLAENVTNGTYYTCNISTNPPSWLAAGASSPITSVFSRVGVITANSGDYNCGQVTNCGLPSNGGTGVNNPTAHGIAVAEGASNYNFINCMITEQIFTVVNGSDPTCMSPGLLDGNGGAAVTTTPYTVQCDSGTTLLDRGSTIRLQSGAATITVPLSTASGCGSGFAFVLMDDGAGTVTVNRSSPDTFSTFNGSTNTDGATSFTITNGQYASFNQGASGIWEVRISPSGSGGSGLPYGVGTGSVNVLAVTTTPPVNVNTAGTYVAVLANLANTTTTPTLAVGTSGALTITKLGSGGTTTALRAADYGTTQWMQLLSDGTNWVLQNPASDQAGLNMYFDASGNLQCLSGGSCTIGGTARPSNITSALFTAPIYVSPNSTTSTILQGGDFNGAGATVTSNATLRGGDASGTGTTTSASVNVRPGRVTSTTGNPGMRWDEEVFTTSGTVTQWDLVCESGNLQVANCGASPTNVIGVAITAANPIVVVTSGNVPITASAAVTLGHFVCSGATAGNVTDNAATTPCATAGQSVGIVEATSGVLEIPEIGGTVTLSTTLPLVHLRFQ